MITGTLNNLSRALKELLAREAQRMCVAERTMRPFTPLERVFPMPPSDCSRLAA